MYTVQKHDEIHELNDVPFPDPGASDPLVLADEDSLVVAYRSVMPVGDAPGGSSSGTSVVVFRQCFAIHYGLPNDAAFVSHPLDDQGVRPCGAFEVGNSSWIRELDTRNRGHPRHDPELFRQLRHWVWTFQDTVLECAAVSYAAGDAGGEVDLLPRMRALLISG
jgi:hypothetical protein